MRELAVPAAQSALHPGSSRRAGQVLAAVSGRDDAPVLHAARLLSERVGADVVVLSVVHPRFAFAGDGADPLVPTSVVESEIAERLELVRREIADVCRAEAGADASAGPNASTSANTDASANAAAGWPVELRCGRPAETIAAEASVSDAQMIVMGIGRHRPIDRLLAAETTLATIRRASCPVYAVTRAMRALPKTVVAATDFGPASVRAIRAALPLLADHARLYVVHVWTREGERSPAHAAADVAYERSLPERFDRLRDQLSLPPTVVLRPVELVGEPAREVLEFANGHGAELVVAGTVGRGFLDRLFVGSVATALLRGSASNVLIAPEPADSTTLEEPPAPVAAPPQTDQWALRLHEFVRRNRGRRTVLEVVDRRLGAYVLESGYALLDAAHHEHGGRIELALGSAADGQTLLTHVVPDALSLDVVTGAGGRDRALSIQGEHVQTRLRFGDR